MLNEIAPWEEPMGTDALNRLRSEALLLPAPERAQLARDLVTSLDGPPDAGVGDAWEQEILSRLAEVDAGTAALIDRDEFRRRMQARIGPR
jgi:putative addiction module component (TIGR02574 family)